MNDTGPQGIIELETSSAKYIWDDIYDTTTSTEERHEIELNIKNFFNVLLSELTRQEGKEYELKRISE